MNSAQFFEDMAKELFKFASHEYKEPAYEAKERKKIAIGALVMFFVFIGLGLYDLRYFTNATSFSESIAIRENQIVFIKVSSWFLSALSALFMAAFLWHKPFWIFALLATTIIDMSIVIVSDRLGYEIFTSKILSMSYVGLVGLCCGIPILTLVLVANRNRKRHIKNSENK